MSKIFWDTNLFIYLFEEHPEFGQPAADLRRRMLLRGDHLVTSSLTLGEVQVKALRLGEPQTARRFKESIELVASVVPFDAGAADAYAIVRAQTEVRGPDAMQLACASNAGVEVFVTNDKRLHSVRVPGIHFITPLDRVPF